MRFRQDSWILVLASGGCEALGYLTTTREGHAVPKQFCSLNGGHSLLQASLRRARRLEPYRRICCVVDRDQERYWRPMLRELPERNITVQPRDRGTMNALLMGVLRILERAPDARIVVLPADHHVLDEETLVNSIRSAIASLDRDREGLLGDRILLLGVVPEDADDALSYIVPGVSVGHGVRDVARFADKPAAAIARELAGRGALCNSLILAAKGTGIVECIRERYPEIAGSMSACIGIDTRPDEETEYLRDLYARLPMLELSHVAGQGGETAFCVFTAPACGWTDLATPRRVGNALHRLWTSPNRESVLGERRAPAVLSLANRFAGLPL